MTRSYRQPRRILRVPRHVDPGITPLGFTCFRIERDHGAVESLFPKLSMALLVRPSAAGWR